MNKQGALLIEVILATAITSLLMAGLMTSIYQLNKAQTSMDARIEAYTRASLIFHQIEHDITGVFMPIQNNLAMQKQEASLAKNTSAPPQVSNTLAPTSEEKGNEKSAEVKPVQDVFIGTREGENLEMISCVTTNPVTVFWSEQAGKPKPRIARVIYRLQKDSQKEPISFTLMRQEGEDLSLKVYDAQDTKARSYELASSIKGMRVEYMIAKKAEKKEGKEAEKQSSDLSKPLEYETKLEWKVKEIKPQNEQDKGSEKPVSPDQKEKNNPQEDPPLIPDYVRITLELWDAALSRSQTFTTTVALLTSVKIDKKPKNTTPTPAQANEKPKTAAPKTAQNSRARRPGFGRQRGVRMARGGTPTGGISL